MRKGGAVVNRVRIIICGIGDMLMPQGLVATVFSVLLSTRMKEGASSYSMAICIELNVARSMGC